MSDKKLPIYFTQEELDALHSALDFLILSSNPAVDVLSKEESKAIDSAHTKIGLEKNTRIYKDRTK